jgi:hypothetical protein
MNTEDPALTLGIARIDFGLPELMFGQLAAGERNPGRVAHDSRVGKKGGQVFGAQLPVPAPGQEGVRLQMGC